MHVDRSVNGVRSTRLTTSTCVSLLDASVRVCRLWTEATLSLTLARTKFDIIIDESSNKPGEQSFEKMIAGLYLGEVFRLVLTELIDQGDLFLGQNTYKLEKAYAVDTAFLSLMERWVRWLELSTLSVLTLRHFYYQRPYRRAIDRDRSLFLLFRSRDHFGRADLFPRPGQVDRSTCRSIECLWYRRDCQQEGIPRGGMRRRCRRFALQREPERPVPV